MPKDSPTFSTPPDDLSTREVAQWLGVTVRTVQLMVDRGDLHAWKTPGGHRRIDRGSVEACRAQPSLRKAAQQATEQPAEPPSAQAFAHVPTPASVPATALPGLDALPLDPVPVHSRSLVLIEPDPNTQRHLQRVLGQTYPDHHVHVASDAITGIALCSSLQPELLLLNPNLPGMDGVTVVRGLAHHPRLRHMPVVVLGPSNGAETTPPGCAPVHWLPIGRINSRALQNRLPL